ncbi:MAG TPA: ankyrin repeat domain-containing protein, partial [bacterium]|nr:ankyrin repeat domain-containing protein [bacterium]
MRYWCLLGCLMLMGCATNLHEAAWRGDVAVLRGADAAMLESRDAGGLTPLMQAVRGNQPKAVALLLNRGSAIDATDSAGRTPLIHAAQTGALAAAQLLVERGAALNCRDA